MNGDIRPPRRPQPSVPTPPVPPPASAPLRPAIRSTNQAAEPAPASGIDIDQVVDQLPVETDIQTRPKSQSPRKPRWWLRVIIALGLLLVLSVAVAVGWYSLALRPVQTGVVEQVEVSIESGMTPDQIAQLLDDEGLIRSQLAFMIYTRLQGVQSSLQAGQYRLAATEDLPAIVDALTKGGDAQFSITFYPGATLYDPTDTPAEKRTDVYTMLTRAGYDAAEVEAALEKSYEHALFAGKPDKASLEGYVYGETYTFGVDTTVEQVLMHTFDYFYEQIEAKGIVAKAKKQDMTLYEAIILGSIIEREVGSQPDDQRQVSQIFHRRLDEGIMLGADATFMYVANQRNVPPRIDIESTYNTRRVAGLPPGPIAAPGIGALEAAVDPAPGDYLYFVSGDDGRTHFAHTQAEHDANTAKYCTTLCQMP